MGMGIRLKLGNRNGKKLELIAWKWKGMGMKNPAPPVISNAQIGWGKRY